MRTETNLEVGMVLVTPEIATNYLRFNSNNRTLRDSHVTFLSNQIKKDLFIENGEAIIFDNKGELKDGQHRLKAISINNKSYWIPIVRGVQSYAMATYDTGKNRSAADILKLNGFKNPTPIAGFVQTLHKYKNKNSKSSKQKSTTDRRSGLSNLEVLGFTENNYDWMQPLVSKTEMIYKKAQIKVLTPSAINLITYMIGGKHPDTEVYDFIKHLLGILKSEASAPLYIYNKLYNSKINKDPLNFYWVLGMSLKAWNFYSDGNPAMKSFSFKIDKELPKVNTIFLTENNN